MDKSLIWGILRKVYSLKEEVFILWTCLLFYFLLWIINPGNKVIAASFLGLILIFYFRLKDIRLSTLVVYLTSVIITSGKTYLIELIPPYVFPEGTYPLGHVSSFVISPPVVLSVMLLVFIIRDFLVGKLKPSRLKVYDYLFFGYYFWLFLSDIIGSNRPEVSLVYSLVSLQYPILYIFIRSYVKNIKWFVLVFVSLVCAHVIFESLISFRQFMEGSPIYKNLEKEVNIITFGEAQDELPYRFRPLGTFRHANLLGLWMSFWLTVIFVVLYKRKNFLIFIIFLIGLVSLVITLSRSAWLGFSISILFNLFVLEKVKKIKTPEIVTKHAFGLLIVFLALFVFFVLPRAERSLYTFSDGGGYFRYAQVQEVMPLIIEHPLFGVGSAMSVPEGLRLSPKGYFSQNPLTIHNWYLVTLAEHGIPTLAFFILFIVLSFRSHFFSLWKNKFKDELDFVRLGLIAGVVSLMTIGFFQPYIGDNLIILSSAILGLKSYETSWKQT